MTMIAYSCTIKVDSFPVMEAREEILRGTKAWRKANSIFCPLGSAPSRAWLLMLKRDVDQLATSSVGQPDPQTQAQSAVPHTIHWTPVETDQNSAANPTTTTLNFPGFYLIKTERLLGGGSSDPLALHLVELADARALGEAISDSGSTVANLRSYANPADYLTGSSGATWDSLVQTLWEKTPLGTYPSLPAALISPTPPATPLLDGEPQNHWFIGLNAYRSLNAVLDQIDCAIQPSPFDGLFNIVQLGDTAAGIPTPTAPLAWDGEPKNLNILQAPANITVYNYSHFKSYGQELDTEVASNWALDAKVRSNTAATNVPGAQGTLPLWDDLPVVLDENGQISNASALSTRIANRQARYVTRSTVNAKHRIYMGLTASIVPGGEIKAVIWRSWGDGTFTEFVAGPSLVYDFYCDASSSIGSVAWVDEELLAPEREQYGPPDLGRHSYPNYPRLPNIVQVSHTTSDTDPNSPKPGDNEAPDVINIERVSFHRGVVSRFIAGQIEELEPCWILFADNYDEKKGNIKATQKGYYGPARLSGMTSCRARTANDDTIQQELIDNPDQQLPAEDPADFTEQLPVYVVSTGSNGAGDLVIFQLLSLSANPEPILDLNTACEALLLEVDITNGALKSTGTIITVVDFYQNPGEWQGMTGLQGLAYKRGDKMGGRDAYNIIWMERPALMNYGQLDGNVANEQDPPDPDNPLQVADVKSGSITFFQQGNKRPPKTSQVFDPQELYPLALGPINNAINNQQPSEGGRFIAVWNDRRRRLDFLVTQQQCFICTATLVNHMRPDDSTAMLRDIKIENFSPFNLPPKDLNQGVLGAFNDMNLWGFKGERVWIAWRDSTREDTQSEANWSIFAVAKPFKNVGLIKVNTADASQALVKIGTDFLPAKFCRSDVPGSRGVTEDFDCLVDFVDFNFYQDDTIVVENHRVYSPAILQGFSDAANGIPIYQCCVGEQEWEAKSPSGDVTKGQSDDFTLLNGDGSDSTITIHAEARWKTIRGSTGVKKCIVKRLSGTFVASQMCEGT